MACMNNEDKVPLCTRKFLSAGLISMQLLTSWTYMGFVSWMITWIALSFGLCTELFDWLSWSSQVTEI